MKKSISMTLMSLIIPMLMCAQTQITLLHTFEGEVSLVTYDYNNTYQSAQYLNGVSYGSTGYYYDYSYAELFRQGRWYSSYFENNTLTLAFWDDNFQPSGQKSIIFPNIENYKVNYFYLGMGAYTTKMFNDDEDVEILVEYMLTSEYTSGKSYREYRDMQYKLVLIKQDGTILYDFGTGNSISKNSYLYYINNKWLFLITKRHYDLINETEYYQTEIYQISKQSPQGLSQVSPAHMPAYPNPAISEINIPSPNSQEVKIYDMNGRLVDTHNGNDEVVNVNVSGYPSGNYIYQTQGNSGVFIKQ